MSTHTDIENHWPSPPHLLQERLLGVKHVALDMDGTIYNGGQLFACTQPFLDQLGRLGIGYSFLTNNSSKSVVDYVAHVRKMGLAATAEQFYISTQATMAVLKEHYPSVRRVFVLGTTSMRQEMAKEGFIVTEDSAEDEPEAVVVGFDTDLTFSRLCRAAWWIKRGKPYLASHPDRLCPTPDPTVLVDCGAICAALYEATGRRPDAVPGKPDARMLFTLAERHGLKPQEMAMVGDRLYTDMAMAHEAGALSVLVLTGEAAEEEALACTPPPQVIAKDLSEFGRLLEAARV